MQKENEPIIVVASLIEPSKNYSHSLDRRDRQTNRQCLLGFSGSTFYLSLSLSFLYSSFLRFPPANYYYLASCFCATNKRTDRQTDRRNEQKNLVNINLIDCNSGFHRLRCHHRSNDDIFRRVRFWRKIYAGRIHIYSAYIFGRNV